MSFFKSITTIIVTVFLLIACEENKTPESDQPETAAPNKELVSAAPALKLEGAWEIVRAEGIAVKSNLGTVYTFEGDNLTMGKDGFNNPGKTEITDSTFSFQAKNNDYKFLFNYHFDGDTLVTSMENSNGQRFYMIKTD